MIFVVAVIVTVLVSEHCHISILCDVPTITNQALVMFPGSSAD